MSKVKWRKVYTLVALITPRYVNPSGRKWELGGSIIHRCSAEMTMFRKLHEMDENAFLPWKKWDWAYYWRTTPLRFHKRCICLKKVQIRIRYQKRQWSKLLTIFETLSPNNILTGEISRISTFFTFGWLASDDRLNIYYGAVRLLNACCLATQMKQ